MHSHFGRQSGAYKAKHTLTIWSAIMLLGIWPKELKTCVHTKAHLDVHGGFFHDRSDSEATKMCSSRQIRCLKRTSYKATERRGGNVMRISKWEKSVWKARLGYNSNSKTFWKRRSCGESRRISGCRGSESGWRWRGETQGLWAKRMNSMIP